MTPSDGWWRTRRSALQNIPWHALWPGILVSTSLPHDGGSGTSQGPTLLFTASQLSHSKADSNFLLTSLMDYVPAIHKRCHTCNILHI